MKRVKETILIGALLLVALGLGVPQADAGDPRSLYQQAQAAHKKLYADQGAQKLRHNWLRVIDAYRKVVEAEPAGSLAEASTLAAGDLYLGLYGRSRAREDADRAAGVFRRLLKQWPRGRSAAHAQLRVGQIMYHVHQDLERAYVELLKVELNHGRHAAQVSEARKLMAKIAASSGYASAGDTKLNTPPPAAKPTPDLSAPSLKQAALNPGESVVTGVRHWHNPTYSRVAVDLSQAVEFNDHLLRPDPTTGKPMRLYLDLGGARLSPNIPEEIPIADGLIQKARVGQFDRDTVRLVLDIQHIGNYRIFSLNDPFRIVVDVMGGRNGPAPAPVDKSVKVASTAPAAPPAPPRPLSDLRKTAKKRKPLPRGKARTDLTQSSLARQLGLGVRTVIIDPGHGGKDHGATGATGLKEKDLVLSAAKMLADKLRKRLGLNVVLTRDKDVFLPLEERTAMANTHGADLFISIHANAHRSAKVHGVETYFLNLATDEEAMRVAARENATTRKNMSDLQVILSDLMLNSKITESGRLGTRVHQAIVNSAKKHYQGVRDLGLKQAPFYVLIGANMPSILVELGFISNRSEESRLKSGRYIDRITDGIVEGVRTYNASIKRSG